jgi:hypothetical protein
MFRSQVVAATDSAKAAIDVFADVDDDHWPVGPLQEAQCRQ